MTMPNEEEEKITTEQETITSFRPDGSSVTTKVHYYSDGTAHIKSESQQVDGSKEVTTISWVSSSHVKSYLSEFHGTASAGESDDGQEAVPQPVATQGITTNNVADMETGNVGTQDAEEDEKIECGKCCCLTALLCYILVLVIVLILSFVIAVSGGLAGWIGLTVCIILIMIAPCCLKRCNKCMDLGMDEEELNSM